MYDPNHMIFKTELGSLDTTKNSFASLPLIKPSMSLSACWNRKSYLFLASASRGPNPVPLELDALDGTSGFLYDTDDVVACGKSGCGVLGDFDSWGTGRGKFGVCTLTEAMCDDACGLGSGGGTVAEGSGGGTVAVGRGGGTVYDWGLGSGAVVVGSGGGTVAVCDLGSGGGTVAEGSGGGAVDACDLGSGGGTVAVCDLGSGGGTVAVGSGGASKFCDFGRGGSAGDRGLGSCPFGCEGAVAGRGDDTKICDLGLGGGVGDEGDDVLLFSVRFDEDFDLCCSFDEVADGVKIVDMIVLDGT
jgi:hypothetical protein